MRVIVFGATGMVGGGALRECLDSPRVESVLAVGRSSCGLDDPKLTELLHGDLFDLETRREELRGYDACFYCLGVSSVGMTEAEYRRVTHDLTVAIVRVLVDVNREIKICFVTGQGTDGTEKGRVMWARVKGQAENALLALPNETYMFRPGLIQPMKGVRPKVRALRILYAILGPVFPLLRSLFPGSVTTTTAIGQVMIRAAAEGLPTSILETRDINAFAQAG